MRLDLIEAINQVLSALGGESAATVADKLRDRTQRRRIVAAARAGLQADENPTSIRGLATLLDDPDFVRLLADPTGLLAGSVDTTALDRWFPPSTPLADRRERLRVIVGAVWGIAIADATVPEAVEISLLGAIDETLLHVVNLGLHTLERFVDLDRKVTELLAALDRDRMRLIDGDPFSADEVDLLRWRMSSDLLGGDVPEYIERDVDESLDRALAPSGRGGLVVLMGDVKTGKTRTALEAIRRNLSGALVMSVRRTRGVDAIRTILGALPDTKPADDEFVLFVDDLADHLVDTNLERLVDEARQIGVYIVATCREAVTGLDDLQSGAWQLHRRDLTLLEETSIRVGKSPSADECARFVRAYPQLANLAGHFPAALAAVEQLRRRTAWALREDQGNAAERSVVLAASQLAIGRGSRYIVLADLVDQARAVFVRLEARDTAALTDDQLEEALRWAFTRVGGPYAVLGLTPNDPETVELAEVSLDVATARAVVPSLNGSAQIRDLFELGVAALKAGNDAAAYMWTFRAAQFGHPFAPYNLGCLQGIAGELEEARFWYGVAMEGGRETLGYEAAANMAALESEAGNHTEAARYRHLATELARQPAAHEFIRFRGTPDDSAAGPVQHHAGEP